MDPGAIGKLGNKVGEAGSGRKVAGEQRTADSAAGGTPPAGDTVNLTSGAKLLERLEKSLASLPDIDSNRVEAIKQAIANGEYEIDAEAIASAMIRLERSLGD
jgi:negative regulator of flagellin synthesis FlgM